MVMNDMTQNRSTKAWNRSRFFRIAIPPLVVLLTLAGTGGALWSKPLGSYDRAQIEAVFYDAETDKPIYATGEELAQRANASNPSSTLFSQYRPGWVESLVVKVGQEYPLGHPLSFLAPHVKGKRAGDWVRTSVYDDGLGGWEHELEISRIRGPLPMGYEFPRDEFEKAYGPAKVGRTFQDERLTDAEMQIVQVNATQIWYRNLFQDGQLVKIRKLEWPAVVSMDTRSDQYTLRLNPEIGSVNKNPCADALFPDLQPGESYRVVGLTETTIRLANSTFPWPHLVERPVYAEIHVIAVQKYAEVGAAFAQGRWP